MSNQRFIIEHGLEGRVAHAVNGCNTIEDLSAYLNPNGKLVPHKSYRLVTCQWVDGNWVLIWERLNHENKGK